MLLKNHLWMGYIICNEILRHSRFCLHIRRLPCTKRFIFIRRLFTISIKAAGWSFHLKMNGADSATGLRGMSSKRPIRRIFQVTRGVPHSLCAWRSERWSFRSGWDWVTGRWWKPLQKIRTINTLSVCRGLHRNVRSRHRHWFHSGNVSLRMRRWNSMKYV